MAVTVSYESQIQFDIAQFERIARKAMSLLDYQDFDLGILLTNDETIHEYNKMYRQKDTATDILSFPYYPELRAGERINAIDADEKNLGDIIISLEYVAQDAQRWNQTFQERVVVLLVHGLFHLLGYDHEVDEDYIIMKEREDWLLKQLEDHA